MKRRGWLHEHSWGFDNDIDDFSLTYRDSNDIEDLFVKMAVNGFSCGYPECCVFDFMRMWWKYAQTRNFEDVRSERFALTETGQRYAQCGAHP